MFLEPQICQLAEMNPHVQFLQVNYDEHKAMCYALNIHVLPFFRFYRGAHGRLCSFSCTNATVSLIPLFPCLLLFFTYLIYGLKLRVYKSCNDVKFLVILAPAMWPCVHTLFLFLCAILL